MFQWYTIFGRHQHFLAGHATTEAKLKFGCSISSVFGFILEEAVIIPSSRRTSDPWAVNKLLVGGLELLFAFYPYFLLYAPAQDFWNIILANEPYTKPFGEDENLFK